jgi:hypothetical protein
MVAPDKLKPASLQVYFGSLDARITPAMLGELGTQVRVAGVVT